MHPLKTYLSVHTFITKNLYTTLPLQRYLSVCTFTFTDKTPSVYTYLPLQISLSVHTITTTDLKYSHIYRYKSP